MGGEIIYRLGFFRTDQRVKAKSPISVVYDGYVLI
jgi:hypothetical protein